MLDDAEGILAEFEDAQISWAGAATREFGFAHGCHLMCAASEDTLAARRKRNAERMASDPAYREACRQAARRRWRAHPEANAHRRPAARARYQSDPEYRRQRQEKARAYQAAKRAARLAL